MKFTKIFSCKFLCSTVVCTYALPSGEGLQSAVMEQFVHVSLGLTGEPCSGVLHRHLMSRLIHSMHGDKPHR